MTTSVFAKFQKQAWPYEFKGRLHVDVLNGGTPSNPKVAEGWIRSKLAPNDILIQQMVAETMAERGISAEDAAEEVAARKSLNGFKRDDSGLYIEGRQLKAGIKEACSVAGCTGKLAKKWGDYGKGLLGFVREHIMVVEDRLYLDRGEPDGVRQSFPINPITKRPGIAYTEFVDGVDIDFTVITDAVFSAQDWGIIWLTGEQQGIGSARSQGYGRYTVTKWEQTR